MADSNIETTPLLKKIVPVRNAAQKAAVTLKEQTTKRPRKPNIQKDPHVDDGESDFADEDDDAGIPRRKGIKLRGSRGSRRRGRGRGGSAAARDNAEQTLTTRILSKALKTASSPSASSSRDTSPVPLGSITIPQKRSLHSLSDTPSKRNKPTSQPSSQSSVGTNSLLPSCRSPGKYTTIYIKNDVVWVRLDSQGVLVDCSTTDNYQSYWWPAQISGDDPMDVSAILFGDDGHGDRRIVDIDSHLSSSVLPFRNDGHIWFSSSTFALHGTHTDAHGGTSAAENTSNLVRRWMAARDQAVEADMDNELPEADLLISLMSSTGGGKKKEPNLSDPNMSKTYTPSRSTRLPITPLDEELKVGAEDGELVLARDHKDRPDHWPARVVGVARDKKTGKWLYEICYIDGKKKKLERHRFFSSDQEGFATCQLGQWHTEFPVSDSEAPDSEDEFRDRHQTRPPSPSPSNPEIGDIKDNEEFCARPLVEQMHYVYPFLCRIIRREYEPSYERHDIFVKGGKGRQQLGQIASSRGHFSENEIKKISLFVRRTMLRDERWARRVRDGDEVQDGGYDTAPPNWSDQAKVETVTDSVNARSSDMDAAMALTELKSSDTCPSLLSSPMPLNASPSNGRESSPACVLSSEIPRIDAVTNAHLLPPSSFVLLDHSSDMELDTDDEYLALSPASPQKAHPSHQTLFVSPATQELKEDVEPLPVVDLDRSINEVPISSASLTRPKGCEAYENLSRSDRGLYCSDVLLPEAILQLHLLRDGRRTSARLLSPEEEHILYQEAQELLKVPVHWVTQILQMRQFAEKGYKKRTKKKDEVRVEMFGGTSTRPRVRKISQ